MKITYCYLIVMGWVFGLIGADVSPASAKTLEAEYASTSWMGSGEVRDLPDGGQVINAIVKGVMIVRHSNGAVGGIVHTAQLECPIRVTLSAKDSHRTYLGLCTVLAHEGKTLAMPNGSVLEDLWSVKASLRLQAEPVVSVESREQYRFSAGLSSRSWRQAMLGPSAMHTGRT